MNRTYSPREALLIRALQTFEQTRGSPPKKIQTFRGMWKWIAKEFSITLPEPNRSVYCNNLVLKYIQSGGDLKRYRTKEHWLYPKMKDTYNK